MADIDIFFLLLYIDIILSASGGLLSFSMIGKDITMEKNYETTLPMGEEACETPESFAGSSKASDFNFKIVRKIGTMSQSSTGWAKELNLVSWNGNKAKFDIRDWSPDHESMSRGIRLTSYEAKKLREFLSEADLDDIPGEEDI